MNPQGNDGAAPAHSRDGSPPDLNSPDRTPSATGRDGSPPDRSAPATVREGSPDQSRPRPVRADRQAVEGRPIGRTEGGLRVCVLGSGSGGNCTVVQRGEQAILIDAGFGPRTTGHRLAQAKIDLTQVRAVCLTHLDQDHFRPTWTKALVELGIAVFVHQWHLPELLRLPGARELEQADLIRPFDGQAFEPLPGLSASTVRLQHDLQGTIGYRFDSAQGSVGYATDLGHAPAHLIDHVAGVGLLCIECNYDEHMTVTSPRPSFVNRRNMSDCGHLSNEQAFDAVQKIVAASPPGSPGRILLMHRSSQCNHPTKIRRVFERDIHLAKRVVLTEQRRRTRWFAVQPLGVLKRDQMKWSF